MESADALPDKLYLPSEKDPEFVFFDVVKGRVFHNLDVLMWEKGV